MLRKTLESITGPMTNSQFAEVMDLVTTDVKINHIAFGKRTSFKDTVEIAVRCFVTLGWGRVA